MPLGQIRPDELIRILRGEFGGNPLLGYEENGTFALGQTVTGTDAVAIGNNSDRLCLLFSRKQV